MIGKPYILTTTDVQRGIQALAAFLLGSADEWPTLVTLNQLAPPYLTLNPASVYGPAVATASLTAALPSAATQLTLPNMPQSTNTLYLSSSTASGLVGESVSVESYQGGVFTFSTPTKNAYPVGSFVQLFAAYTTGNTQVLLPGDTLYVPVTSTSFTVATNGQLTDGFGADIAYPISFSGGDLATVQGLPTLNQRLAAAIQTQVASLPLHLQFGSELQASIGQNESTTKWTALLRDCLLRLPEVANVQNVQTMQTGTTLYVTATVNTHTSDAAIQLTNQPFTLVG